MSEDRGDGAGSAGGKDDLRSVITEALAEDAKKADDAASPGASPGAAPGGDSGAAAPAEDRRRDGASRAGEQPPAADLPTGRDRTREDNRSSSDDKTPESPDSGAKTGEEDADASGEPQKSAERPDEPPKNWSAEDREMFGRLPEAARAPFLGMYKRMEAGFTRNLQRGAYLEREYGEIENNIFTRENRQAIAAKGATIPQVVRAWADVERALTGPDNELRSQMIARIIHAYKGDTTRIAAVINELRGFAPAAGSDAGGAGTNGADAPAATAPGGPAAGGNGQISPQLEARFRAIENEQRTRYRTEANQMVEAFANERDDQGQLKHPHYSELEADIADLAVAERQKGRLLTPADLPVLYERALWANPSTREKQLRSEREAATQRAADEERQRAERARRAGSSVTGAPGGPGQSTIPDQELSIRDNIVRNMNTPSRSGGGGRRI